MVTKPNNGLQAESGFTAQPIARQAECVSACNCHLSVPSLPLKPNMLGNQILTGTRIED